MNPDSVLGFDRLVDPAGFLDLCLLIAQILILLAMLLGFVRIYLGPTFSDRVVALDMSNVSLVAFCAIFAMQEDAPAFLDVAIVLALIGFLATVSFARFAERGLHGQSDGETAPPADHVGSATGTRGTPLDPSEDRT